MNTEIPPSFYECHECGTLHPSGNTLPAGWTVKPIEVAPPYIPGDRGQTRKRYFYAYLCGKCAARLPFDDWEKGLDAPAATRVMEVDLEAGDTTIEEVIAKQSPEHLAQVSFHCLFWAYIRAGFSREDSIEAARECVQENYENGSYTRWTSE